MPRKLKNISQMSKDKKGEIINFYEHVPKKYLDDVEI